MPDDINIVRLDCYKAETQREEMIKLGYLLNKRDRVGDYIDWHDEYVDVINYKVSKISDDNKTRVFIDGGGGNTVGRVDLVVNEMDAKQVRLFSLLDLGEIMEN